MLVLPIFKRAATSQMVIKPKPLVIILNLFKQNFYFYSVPEASSNQSIFVKLSDSFLNFV